MVKRTPWTISTPFPDHTMVPGVAGVYLKFDPTRALGPHVGPLIVL